MRDRKNKDLRILKSTLVYCEDVESAFNRFGKDYEVFAHDRVFFHAISMSVMQIGVLSNNLSEEFKEKKRIQVDWRWLRYIRNLFAHAYSNINIKTVWEFATVFISIYAAFCRQEIQTLQKEMLKRYLLPSIAKNLLVKHITPILIEIAWAKILLLQSKKKKLPLEQATLEKIASLLKQILLYGYRHEFISFDIKKIELKIPNDRKILAIQRRKKKFLEKEEIHTLFQAIDEKYESNRKNNKMGKLYFDMAEFLIRNGLRIGELSALTVEKVHFSAKKISD